MSSRPTNTWAFLSRASFSPGTATGQWYVVGTVAGPHEVSGGAVNRLDSPSTMLPAGLSVAEMDAAVLASPTQEP